MVMFLLVLLGAWQLVAGAPAEDLITYLPGIDVQPFFREWAGYLEASPTDFFFYWFVEAEHNPMTAPVVLWLNGGPGCSSMTGFLSENGPFRSHSDGTLTYFKYSWSRNANMIFMDSPSCVGYSYSTSTPGNCASNDTQTAHLNHQAMRNFFLDKFPEYANRDFYITGESYAGVYIPMLASLCINDPQLNFQGFMIGNGVTDRVLMGSGLVYFEYGHGFFMDDLWRDLVAMCCPGGDSKHCYFAEHAQEPGCEPLMDMVSYLQWESTNPYGLDQACYGGFTNFSNPRLIEANGKKYLPFPYGIYLSDKVQRQYDETVHQYRDKGISFYGTIPCTDTSDRSNYLDRQDVRDALHVPPFVPDWEACSDTLSYTKEFSNMTDFFNDVLHHEGPGGPKRTWMYYGDTDLACNLYSGSWFAEDDLKQPTQTEYRRWMFSDEEVNDTMQTGGWIKDYTLMKYLTVLGSGHMVPTDAPQQAYLIFQNFINNLEFDTLP